MGVPIKKTIVIEAKTHTTHRKTSEIILTNFFPLRLVYVTWSLGYASTFSFRSANDISFPCKSVLKLSILNRNACLEMNVIIKNIVFVVFSKRSMTMCVCVCVCVFSPNLVTQHVVQIWQSVHTDKGTRQDVSERECND